MAVVGRPGLIDAKTPRTQHPLRRLWCRPRADLRNAKAGATFNKPSWRPLGRMDLTTASLRRTTRSRLWFRPRASSLVPNFAGALKLAWEGACPLHGKSVVTLVASHCCAGTIV
jgi:hypothetical protein